MKKAPFVLIIVILSCTHLTDAQKLVNILENRYANLEVNKGKKIKIISEIKKKLKSNDLSESNISMIQELIKKMGDHHLVLKKFQKEKVVNRCVSTSIENNDTFVLKIHSLWCVDKKMKPFEKLSGLFRKNALKAKNFPNLVVDLRDNGGGGDKETRYILSRLIKKRSFLYEHKCLSSESWPYISFFSKWRKRKVEYIDPSLKAVDYLGDKNITVLINKNTFSSAEVIASVLKETKTAILVGEKTKGGAGGPRTIRVFEKKYEFVYTTCLLWQENGELYEGIGVKPDIYSSNSFLQKGVSLSTF